jgi:putative hemolysin
LETELFFKPLIFIFLSIQSLYIGYIISLLLIILLLFLSAIISGSKVAFFQISPESKQNNPEKQDKTDNKTSLLLKNPGILSAFLLITGILTNVVLIIIWLLLSDNIIQLSEISILFVAFIKIALITCILVIFCEILPKLIASNYPVKFSKFSASVIYYPFIIFKPLSKLFVHFNQYIEKRFVWKKAELSISELSDAIELTNETSSENKKILKGIASYGSIYTVEIMRPRVDVVAFDISSTFDEILNKIRNHKHSRIPIYSETFDNIKGILYVKDLLPHYHKKTFNWQTLIRPAYFIPESKKINDLLTDFQTKKIHMAIVIDEYGGTSGIITLEDVLEEIVGEIVSEIDPDDESFKKIDENNYIFEGKTLLNDFFKIIEIDDNYFDEVPGDADTLAGVILEMHGEIPKSGTVFPFKDFLFTIISSDKRRIKQIKVTKVISSN